MGLILHGVPIGSGIAIGVAHRLSHSMGDVSHYSIEATDLESELLRFDDAISATVAELETLSASIQSNAPADLAAFLSMHIQMLMDESLSLEPKNIIKKQLCNAEWALKLQRDDLVAQFEAMEDAYLRERQQDVKQVTERIFKALSGVTPSLPESTEDRPIILVAHDLSPADMVFFKAAQLAAFITDVGGATSHTAILGRSLEAPSVIALHHAGALIRDDEWIIVDGEQGVVVVHPDEQTLAHYRQRQTEWLAANLALASLTHLPATTQNGETAVLLGNIELPDDVPDVLAAGGEGIGLFRSEFLFLNRDTLPTEEEQFLIYKQVIEAVAPHPVTIRSMDLGADKSPRWMAYGQVENPALGLTGLRLCLAEPLLFRTQLRAVLRAAAFGRVRLLLPMVTCVQELKLFHVQLTLAKEELDKLGMATGLVDVGAMIEIPGAALIVRSFFPYVDFISIGTNDLIQYLLATDRNDDAVRHLYDSAHPAVIQLLAQVIQAALAANVEVGICGEMGGDTRYSRLLFGMGLRRYSMHPSRLLAVKSCLRQFDATLHAPLIATLLQEHDRAAIEAGLSLLNA